MEASFFKSGFPYWLNLRLFPFKWDNYLNVAWFKSYHEAKQETATKLSLDKIWSKRNFVYGLFPFFTVQCYLDDGAFSVLFDFLSKLSWIIVNSDKKINFLLIILGKDVQPTEILRISQEKINRFFRLSNKYFLLPISASWLHSAYHSYWSKLHTYLFKKEVSCWQVLIWKCITFCYQFSPFLPSLQQDVTQVSVLVIFRIKLWKRHLEIK